MSFSFSLSLALTLTFTFALVAPVLSPQWDPLGLSAALKTVVDPRAAAARDLARSKAFRRAARLPGGVPNTLGPASQVELEMLVKVVRVELDDFVLEAEKMQYVCTCRVS